MNQHTKKIAFVGGGHMAEAFLSGLIQQEILLPNEILVTEIKAERRDYLQKRYHIDTIDDNTSAPQRSKTVLLAVKPQMLGEVKDDLAAHLTGEHILISILAGTSRQKLADALGHPGGIVRVMPNLPALVGCGVSAITFPDGMRQESQEWVKTILRAVGEVVEVPEEQQDAVTAVSGSGPGYIFYLAQQLVEAAAQQGLDERTAKCLVTEMIAGSAAVLRSSADSPGQWVAKVATPGGTTEAGLSALKEFDLAGIIQKTVERAVSRAQELNRG